jgi:hypothetical protein
LIGQYKILLPGMYKSLYLQFDFGKSYLFINVLDPSDIGMTEQSIFKLFKRLLTCDIFVKSEIDFGNFWVYRLGLSPPSEEVNVGLLDPIVADVFFLIELDCMFSDIVLDLNWDLSSVDLG